MKLETEMENKKEEKKTHNVKQRKGKGWDSVMDNDVDRLNVVGR